MSYIKQLNKILIKNSIAADIDQIIEFEKSNLQFVCDYSYKKHLELLDAPDCKHLSIFHLDNKNLIGHIILFGLTNPNKSLELKRITINEKGHGFGRDAIQWIKKYCFQDLTYHRLWLDVYEDNGRAIHLYESEGFVLEGTLRESIKTNDGYRSLRIYSILESGYSSRK